MNILEWLAASAGDLTASAILVAIIIVVVFGVQNPGENDKWGRPWWVPGWTYKQCVIDGKKKDEQLEGYVDDLKRRVDEMEDLQRAPRRRTRA